uniref:Uncharacterized protein n=2 Tax=Brassica oleracea TaxID=3712 RepID=A0A0D3BX47_BRAOL
MWMDEFLDFSATRRGTHRRSISDSIAFLEAHSSGVGSHHFDKFEDEQFMFMFNDDVHQNNRVNGIVGHILTHVLLPTRLHRPQNSLSENDNKEQPPSDHDHIHMFTTTANDNNVEGYNYNESDEVQSHCSLQENIGILTDIPTENEILGISRGISEETLRKPKIWVSSEFPRNIPTEFRGNINPSEYSEEIPTN